MLEFTWQSFAMAAANFLVLVAVLYKLLHKPLLAVLQKRRETIEGAQRKVVEEAKKARQARSHYETKLAAIEQERDEFLSEARKNADEARKNLLKKAREEAEREVANLMGAYERERTDALRQLQEDIADASVEMARRILEKLSDTDVEDRLRGALHEELEALEKNSSERERQGLFAGQGSVRVLSARELKEQEREKILDRIRAIADGEVEVEFETDGGLIAGARVEFSSAAVDSSLSDIFEALQEGLLKQESEGEADTQEEG